MTTDRPTAFAFTKLVVADVDGMADYYCTVFGFHRGTRDQFDNGVGGEPIDEIALTAKAGDKYGALTLLKFMKRPAVMEDETILGFTTPDLSALLDRVKRAGGHPPRPHQGTSRPRDPSRFRARSRRTPERAGRGPRMSIVSSKQQSGADETGHGDVREVADAPRRGRPPRLSRQGIVDSVLAIFERAPNEVPTIASIAREVEAVPAALYRHFESLEDILDCVMAGILEASHSLPDDEVSWQRQLDSWMRDLRSHLLRYPAILAMIGRTGRTSPAWLEASSALVEILGRAGLSGRDLAAGYLWVLETTVGLVMQEAVLPLPDQIAHARASRHEFSAAARARFAPIVHEVELIDGEGFFSFAVEQAIAAIELRARSPRKT